MTGEFVLPTRPLYSNAAGQDIYSIAGANVGQRPLNTPPRYLIIHHTAGVDSRKYLWQNDLGVSAHYLVGIYRDTGGAVRVYKYAGEASEYTYTQGFSTIGPITDPNKWCISIEMEGPPIPPAVFTASARLAWSILRYWASRGHPLVMLGHRHIDRRGKQDPAVDWQAFCEEAYRR